MVDHFFRPHNAKVNMVCFCVMMFDLEIHNTVKQGCSSDQQWIENSFGKQQDSAEST